MTSKETIRVVSKTGSIRYGERSWLQSALAAWGMMSSEERAKFISITVGGAKK